MTIADIWRALYFNVAPKLDQGVVVIFDVDVYKPMFAIDKRETLRASTWSEVSLPPEALIRKVGRRQREAITKNQNCEVKDARVDFQY